METENHTIVQAQERVDRFISQFEEGYFSPTTMIMRLAEELGELSREVNHLYGEKPKKKTEKEKRIEDELGDLFFVLITFANSLDIDLNEAFEISMSKIETRDQDRWTLKEEENE